MNDLILAALLGLGGGAVYAMLGAGIVTAFKGSGVINFAQGAFAMYAAFVYDELRSKGSFALPWVDFLPTDSLNIPVSVTVNEAGGTSQWVAVTIALAVAAMIGLLAHLLVFRPLRAAPALSKVIGAVGLTIYLQAVALVNYGSGSRAPEGFVPKEPIGNFLGLGGSMPRLNLYLAGSAVLMGAAVWALLRFSRFGLATRAADENEKGAVVAGVLTAAAGRSQLGARGAARRHRRPALRRERLAEHHRPHRARRPRPRCGAAGWSDIDPGRGRRRPGARDVPSGDGGAHPAQLVAGCPPAGRCTGDDPAARHRRLPLPERGGTSRAGHGHRASPSPAPEPNNVLVGALLPVVIALLLSRLFTSGWEVALTSSILAALLMLSWVVITGYLGQISLVQLSLAGVAAYVAARLSADVEKVSNLGAFSVTGPNLPDPLAALLGVAAAVGLGVLIGLPAVRIRGVQLAVVTLAASAPIGLLLLRNDVIFSEAVEGNYPVPRPEWFGAYVGAADPGTARTDYWRFTVFAVVVTAAVALAVAGLRRGATGRRFLAVRANERAAAAAGINVARAKLTGFAIAAGIAGLAGVLQSYRLGSIRTDAYGLFVGLALFAFVYLGGITSVYGAVIGGLLVSGGLIAHTIDTHADGGFEQYVPVVGAIGLILTAIVHPEGIALANAEMGKKLWHRVRGAPAARPAETRSTLDSAPVGGR